MSSGPESSDQIEVLGKTDEQIESEQRETANLALVQISSMLVNFAESTGDQRIKDLAELSMKMVKGSDAMDTMIKQFGALQAQASGNRPKTRAESSEEFKNNFADALRSNREQRTQINQQVLELSKALLEKYKTNG